MRIIEYIYMKFIASIDIEIIMSIDTITFVYVDMKKGNLHEGYCIYRHKDYYCVCRHEKKETYTKIIVSIDIKIIIPLH